MHHNYINHDDGIESVSVFVKIGLLQVTAGIGDDDEKGFQSPANGHKSFYVVVSVCASFLAYIDQ